MSATRRTIGSGSGPDWSGAGCGDRAATRGRRCTIRGRLGSRPDARRGWAGRGCGPHAGARGCTARRAWSGTSGRSTLRTRRRTLQPAGGAAACGTTSAGRGSTPAIWRERWRPSRRQLTARREQGKPKETRIAELVRRALPPCAGSHRGGARHPGAIGQSRRPRTVIPRTATSRRRPASACSPWGGRRTPGHISPVQRSCLAADAWLAEHEPDRIARLQRLGAG